MKYNKNYFEIYAKLSLDILYDKNLSKLEKSESPDWIMKGNSFGIEITRATIEKWEKESNFITKDFGKGFSSKEIIKKINKQRKHKIKGKLLEKNDTVCYSPTKGLYDLDIRLSKIISSINKKQLEKLPKYKELREYWLYVFAEVSLNLSDIENIKNNIIKEQGIRSFKKIFINCEDKIFLIENTEQTKEIIVNNEILELLKKESLKLSNYNKMDIKLEPYYTMKTNEYKRLIAFVEINPKEKLKKNTLSKKIGMDKLYPNTKQIQGFSVEEYKGGSKFRNGDTLLARITPCLENGKTAQVSILAKDEIGFGSTEFIVLRAKKNISNKDYIYYLSISKEFRDIAIKSMVGTSGRQRVQQSVLEQSKFFVPPLPTQKKIASILSDLDDKIELNNKINKNLEEMAQAIFINSFPNYRSGDKCIGDFITPKRGKGLLSKNAIIGKVPVVAGGLAPSTYHNEANTIPPVISISASGANAGYVNLWEVPIWSSDSSFIDTTISLETYFWYLLLKLRQQEIFDSQTGSAQPHIYPKHIMNMRIPNFKIEGIHMFTEQVTPLFKKIGKNKEENKNLTNLRDTLLPKLMSGELDVSNLEI